MTTTISAGYRLFEKDAADELAARMNKDEEDGWMYVARHDPTGKGKSFIEIFDEDGFSVGRLP
jgi:hypothetical protein